VVSEICETIKVGLFNAFRTSNPELLPHKLQATSHWPPAEL